MRCYHCGQEIENGVEYCTYCGANQGAGATVVLDQVFNPYATEPESGATDPLVNTGAYGYPATNTAIALRRPVIQFPTDRSLLKMILLGLVTLGIYDLVIYSRIVSELNIAAARYDGKKTMPYFAMLTLTPFTLGIAAIVWMHKMCDRMGAELNRRGIEYNFSASAYWLWGVLGSLIVIGPFVFWHKLLKASNLINTDFNEKG